ncbi:phytosulfokine receptor 2-like [Salvia divinorum]|uniref:Phytosulfokine receptor 2-like n=1 Tax=Salvia divinorum TaxID=28513 RepID=A0ABD1HBQ8_SALDI
MDQTLSILAAMASFFVVILILGSILIICDSESKLHRRRRSYLVVPKPNPSPSISDSFDPSLPHVNLYIFNDYLITNGKAINARASLKSCPQNVISVF